jgi:hypothetical protein
MGFKVKPGNRQEVADMGNTIDLIVNDFAKFGESLAC